MLPQVSGPIWLSRNQISGLGARYWPKSATRWIKLGH